MSKHGGSPVSGLIEPVGVDRAAPDDGGVVLVPPQVLEARREASERQGRALQFERRRLALEVLPRLAQDGVENATSITRNPEEVVANALAFADALIKQTGGVV